MTKKSHRQAVQYENQSGCMWGFISILDFRSRSTRKLLSDRKHWRQAEGNTSNKFEVLRNYNEDSQSTLGGEENSTSTAGVGKPSVKKLMEEEMFGEADTNKDIRNVEASKKQVDDGSQVAKGHKRKKKKKNKNKTGKKNGNVQSHNLNASGDLGSQHSCHQNSEQQPVSNLNIDAIIREFCSQVHRESLSCEEHDLDGKVDTKCGSEEKLYEAVKVFMNQKCSNEEPFEENGKFQNPKALMDALEILRTDKELFLKVLEESKLEWLKSSPNLKDDGEEKDEKSKSNQEISNPIKPELTLRKKHNFFRRMAKSPDRNSLNRSEDSQASNRIVILSPGPVGMQNSETQLAGSYRVTKNKDSSARSASHFSFSELKRRLKHAMGKEHQEISSNVMLGENSNEYQNPGSCGKGALVENVGMNSPTKDHFFMERIVKPSTATRMREARKSKDSEISMANDSDQRVSNIYVEAKKHLSALLSNDDEDENTSNKLVQKSLGRILSLPEYGTPTASPAREQEPNFIATKTRLSISDNSEIANESTLRLEAETINVHSAPSTQNMEAQTCNSNGKSCDSPLSLDSNPNILNGAVSEDVKEITISVMDETSSGGDVEIANTIDGVAKEDLLIAGDLEIANTIDGVAKEDLLIAGDLEIANTTDGVAEEEEINAMDSPSESVSSYSTEQISETSKTFDGKGYSEDLEEDVYEENQPQSSPLGSPLRFSIAQKVEDMKNGIDMQDRPSPISVLEPLFIEDETSPAETESQPVELPIQPLRIQFELESSDTDEAIHLKSCRDEKEYILEYVKAVLQASGLNWDKLYMRSLSSDQLLSPTLLDENELFANELCHDKQLLFDGINEVLMEAYFGCSPWVSFVKPSISFVPNMKNAIQVAWEGICWHLLHQPLSRTLEQIVGKDMAKSGMWVDLRSDVESICTELCEVILEELMEETVFSCADEIPRSAYPDLKETEISINL